MYVYVKVMMSCCENSIKPNTLNAICNLFPLQRHAKVAHLYEFI